MVGSFGPPRGHEIVPGRSVRRARAECRARAGCPARAGRLARPARLLRLLARGFALLLVLSPPVAAETRLTAGLEVYESILRTAPDDWRFLSSGTGSLSITSAGSRNVRGELALSVPLASTPTVAIDRAYVRFRLPRFRLTAGSTALSWGEGLLLNSGDLPNPGYDPTGDLLVGDYRSSGIWQVELFIPLGPLSFVELLVLPELPELPTLAGLGDARAGGRAYIDADIVAFQAGYLYDEPMHRVYGSVQGYLGVELYAAFAHEVAQDASDVAESLVASFEMSAGGFHTVSLPRDRSLSLRVETRLKPTDLEAGIATGATLGALVDFAVLPTLSLGLQALVAPTDPSALLSGVVSWNMDQGLTILGAASGNLGEDGTAHDATAFGSPAVTLGVRYSF